MSWRQSLRGFLLPVLLLAALLLAAKPAGAEPLAFGFRLAPPYVIQQTDGSLAGLEYELVTAAAQAGGLELRAEIAPFGRLPEDFRRGSSDAFVPAASNMQLPGCRSETLLIYRNTAFTLRQRQLTIARPADLDRFDVLAFQNAHSVLGAEVEALWKSGTRYREIANQMLQVRALFSGRTDAVIADRRIFRYLMRRPDSGIDAAQEVAEHNLFPPTPYAAAFRADAQCRAFNAGLARIKRDGAFDSIMQRWENGPAR